MEEGTRVKWVGVQWPHPGTVGTVLSVAEHDENQIKVLWDDRPKWQSQYTFERRKNLSEVS